MVNYYNNHNKFTVAAHIKQSLYRIAESVPEYVCAHATIIRHFISSCPKLCHRTTTYNYKLKLATVPTEITTDLAIVYSYCTVLIRNIKLHTL